MDDWQMDAPRTDDGCNSVSREGPILSQMNAVVSLGLFSSSSLRFLFLPCFHRPAFKSEADALPCLFLTTKLTIPKPFRPHSQVLTSPVTGSPTGGHAGLSPAPAGNTFFSPLLPIPFPKLDLGASLTWRVHGVVQVCSQLRAIAAVYHVTTEAIQWRS